VASSDGSFKFNNLPLLVPSNRGSIGKVRWLRASFGSIGCSGQSNTGELGASKTENGRVHTMKNEHLINPNDRADSFCPPHLTRHHSLPLILFASVFLATAGWAQTYSTSFEGTENPLSEGGKWTNDSLDWTQIRKRGGIACGTQTGTNTGTYKFDDSFAYLSGFPPDQEAWGKAYIARPNASCNQEIEILLRWTSSPHSTTGYECFARCLNDGSSYLEIVRWDGPLGKFTYLARMRGTNYGLKNGDILKASIVGNLITVSVNDIKKAQVKDDTFKTGNPGIGEFLACNGGQGIGSNTDFGFSSFTARGMGGTNAGTTKKE